MKNEFANYVKNEILATKINLRIHQLAYSHQENEQNDDFYENIF